MDAKAWANLLENRLGKMDFSKLIGFLDDGVGDDLFSAMCEIDKNNFPELYSGATEGITKTSC